MKALRYTLLVLFMAVASIGKAQFIDMEGFLKTPQVTVSTTQLNGTKWKLQGNTSGSIYEYTQSKNIWHHKDGSSFTYPYYLTDTPITSYEYSAFDHSKVGKKTKGGYMVTVNEKQKVVYCAAIRSFNKKKGIFVLKLVTEGLIGTGDGISTYEMVK